jgi:hypothetical protein
MTLTKSFKFIKVQHVQPRLFERIYNLRLCAAIENDILECRNPSGDFAHDGEERGVREESRDFTFLEREGETFFAERIVGCGDEEGLSECREGDCEPVATVFLELSKFGIMKWVGSKEDIRSCSK